jgi:hypothetical protein
MAEEQPISSETETRVRVTQSSCLLLTLPTRYLTVITQFLRHCISVDFTQSQQLKQRHNTTQPINTEPCRRSFALYSQAMAPPRARWLYRQRVCSARSNYPIDVPTSAQSFISDILESSEKEGHNRCGRHTIGVH